MKLKDKFRFIRQNIKKNKVRTFMTILATAMGCAFLIVLASIGYGIQKSVVEDTLEQQVVTEIDVYGYEEGQGNYRSLTLEDITYLENIDNVKAVTRRNEIRQIPTFKIGEYQIDTVAVSIHYPSEVESGLELADGVFPSEENEVIVGSHFANYLAKNGEDVYDDETGEIKEEFLYKESIKGKTIEMQFADNDEQVHTIPLTIVGVMEEPTREWMQDQSVYISSEVLAKVEEVTGTPRGELGVDPEVYDSTERSEVFDSVSVYANNLEDVQEISDRLEEANYATYSVVSELKQINMLFTVAKAGLILVGTIAIIIASIGIYNTMTMAVTERAPDIGIMKAIGANPKTIKQIFLMESSYIGVIGAVIGVAVAYLTSVLVNTGLPLILEATFGEELPEGLQFSSIPFSLVLISVAICLIVTIVSGLRPAKRATELDVLRAMRREF
ncbi:FtsX-like permease family protein [Oceanobacillus piezotolerans]|uniref:FtsX-like permease family protein n=1 Tax=Oceanobacillus piezotolerans TaxID=2448030 RepID=A0A498DET9_9BACI|nr:ABC transporter permease [Oceanobacillus piezotolerans]RLL42039.1 FtsX-like permease family protein [Oceanobacillus piezotolerans]